MKEIAQAVIMGNEMAPKLTLFLKTIAECFRAPGLASRGHFVDIRPICPHTFLPSVGCDVAIAIKAQQPQSFFDFVVCGDDGFRQVAHSREDPLKLCTASLNFSECRQAKIAD